MDSVMNWRQRDSVPLTQFNARTLRKMNIHQANLVGQASLATLITIDSGPCVAGVQYVIDFFIAGVASSVLEDSILALRICDNNATLKRYTKLAKLDYHRKVKFQIALTEAEKAKYDSDLEAISDPKHDDLELRKALKLETDADLCEKVLTDLYIGLAIHWTFLPLVDHVKDMIRKKSRLAEVTHENLKNKARELELKKQHSQQKRFYKICLAETNERIIELLNNNSDGEYKVKTQEAYMENWESARRSQNNLIRQKAEEAVTESMLKYKKLLHGELRAHTELDRINTIIHNDMMNRIDEVVTKYDRDIEVMEVKIKKQQILYEDAAKRRRELEVEYVDKKKEMNAWIQYKKDRKEEAELAQKKQNAAIMIQAWWRGYLARHMKINWYPKTKKGLKGTKKRRP